MRNICLGQPVWCRRCRSSSFYTSSSWLASNSVLVSQGFNHDSTDCCCSQSIALRWDSLEGFTCKGNFRTVTVSKWMQPFRYLLLAVCRRCIWLLWRTKKQRRVAVACYKQWMGTKADESKFIHPRCCRFYLGQAFVFVDIWAKQINLNKGLLQPKLGVSNSIL